MEGRKQLLIHRKHASHQFSSLVMVHSHLSAEFSPCQTRMESNCMNQLSYHISFSISFHTMFPKLIISCFPLCFSSCFLFSIVVPVQHLCVIWQFSFRLRLWYGTKLWYHERNLKLNCHITHKCCTQMLLYICSLLCAERITHKFCTQSSIGAIPLHLSEEFPPCQTRMESNCMTTVISDQH